MEIDLKRYEDWLTELEQLLPNIKRILKSTESSILVIGAAVLELYAMHNWIPKLRRQTGDLDLSIGITTDNLHLYDALKKTFLSYHYTQDPEILFRLHPPKNRAGVNGYVDLLAHPATAKTSDHLARRAMNVADSFSMRGYDFASLAMLRAARKINFPNPLGFIRLKIEAYQDNPIKRLKDFADIVELITGLVHKGTHFELGSIWSVVKPHLDSKKIEQLLLCLEQDSSLEWDIDEIKTDLITRGFPFNGMEKSIQLAAKELREALYSA